MNEQIFKAADFRCELYNREERNEKEKIVF